MATAVAGLDCYTYRNTATWGSPTWALISTIQDVSGTFSRTEIEAASRESKFKKFLGGLIDSSLTLKLLRKKGDTQQAALKTAFLAQPPTVTSYAFADGPIATTGTIYAKIECIVTEYSDLEESLEGAAMVQAKLRPAAQGTNEPTEVTV
jgi:hypothetical protein